MVSKSQSFVSIFVWIVWSFHSQVLAISCKVSPSGYAYRDDSVFRTETDRAQCRSYPPVAHVMGEDYMHCNGTQLKLTDSNYGSEQFRHSDYYIWPSGKLSSHLLFIFPTRVNLTTIAIHFYSNSTLGLPRLRFLQVKREFDIWDAPTLADRHVEITAVQLGGDSASLRNVSIHFEVNTTKILMIKLGSTVQFAMSEVEFLTCTDTLTTPRFTSAIMHPLTTNPEAMTSTVVSPKITHASTLLKGTTESYQDNINTTTQGSEPPLQSGDNVMVSITIGLIAIVVILLAALSIIILLLLQWYNKRTGNVKMESDFKEDLSYSTLNRGAKQETQPPSLNPSVELYDQIQLSPSTGQSELIHSKILIISSSSGSNQMQESTVTETNSELLEMEKNNLGNPTYAVVDKRKKNKVKMKESKQEQDNKPQKGIDPEHLTVADPEDSDTAEKLKDQPSQRQENLEEMYAVVHKKPKKCEEQDDAPLVPSHTIESLYAAVQKKPK